MLQIPNFVVYYCWTFVQIVQSSSILAEFSTKNNFGIQNLAIQDEKTIFLGTTNYLYKLESENLHILDFIQTGPVMDSPYCNFNGDCTNWNNKKTVNKSMIDNYNKILLLIKAKNRTLISCGSVKQGVCNFYASSDFRELDEISPKIAVASNAKNASTVAFLDLENFETLFVGASYTLEPYRHEFPAVASRTLASRSLQLRNQNAVGQSAMILRTENRWDFKIDYIFGFYAQKFAYWALVQKESLSHGAPMVSKLARICSQDQDYSSYSEIILECLDQQNFKFNILKSAFFGQISGKFYLFGIFEKFSKSALCIFPLKDVDSSFKLNIERCLNGIDYSNLPHFGLNRKCQKIAGNRRDNSSCNKINVGGSLPLTKVTSLTATAAILTSVTAYGETLFVGTNNGQILKVIFSILETLNLIIRI
uniref:Sema domain-containing protein n=1 Tax=Romanomermis culicivorax TaxID=13658 RepID=A0A915HVK0_ROMCU